MPALCPFWVAGSPVYDGDRLQVPDRATGRHLIDVAVPCSDQVELAVAAAEAVRDEARGLPAYRRAEALDHVARRTGERSEEFAQLITAETGKPIKWARAEVKRAVSTFRFGAEEARRLAGYLQRLDTDASGAGRLALVRRFPRGPILAITPFNFPLNLVAHKVAPAVAVGAPIIVKPAPAAPCSALRLGELLAETDLPAGMWSVLPVPNDRMGQLVTDPRLPVISFTGSASIGWSIRSQAPHKHVMLELGGNAAVIVTEDAPLEYAARRVATFATYQAGQSCISVQRVFVQRDVHDLFLELLKAAVEAQRTGVSTDPETDVGPLIDDAAAARVERWVAEAVAAGASVVTGGGQRHGASYPPTILTGVTAEMKVQAEEVFGPVLTVTPYTRIEEAFRAVNYSAYGLQAGIFTRDINLAFRAHRELEVGGLIVGDVPTYRADQMPYGGVKKSGIGREGVSSAMQDLTEPRVMVLTGLDL